VYDNLIENTVTGVQLALLFALLYLVIGLIRPRWAGAAGRGSVVLRSFGIALLAVLAFAGVIGYTHSQADGPHSIDSYLKDMTEDDWRALRGEPAPAPTPETPDAPPP
jgi:hypothetical protein